MPRGEIPDLLAPCPTALLPAGNGALISCSSFPQFHDAVENAAETATPVLSATSVASRGPMPDEQYVLKAAPRLHLLHDTMMMDALR